MNKILLISCVAVSLVAGTQAEAYYHHRHHGWHRHWHHGNAFGASGTRGRLGLGASPRHPEGPGNPAGGK